MVRYAFIESLLGEYAIAKMCSWTNVSRSGYYRRRHRESSNRAMQRLLVVKAVNAALEQFIHRYVAPRLVEEWNAQGISRSKSYKVQLFAEKGLKAHSGKVYKFFPRPDAINHVIDKL